LGSAGWPTIIVLGAYKYKPKPKRDNSRPNKNPDFSSNVHALSINGHALLDTSDPLVNSPEDTGVLPSREFDAPQHSLHPGQQFGDAERLGHIIIGAHVQASYLIGVLHQGSEHDDRLR